MSWKDEICWGMDFLYPWKLLPLRSPPSGGRKQMPSNKASTAERSARWSWWNDWAKAASNNSNASGGCPWTTHVLTHLTTICRERHEKQQKSVEKEPSNTLDDVPRWGYIHRYNPISHWLFDLFVLKCFPPRLKSFKMAPIFNTNSRIERRTQPELVANRNTLGVLKNRAPKEPSHILPTYIEIPFTSSLEVRQTGSNRQRGYARAQSMV